MLRNFTIFAVLLQITSGFFLPGQCSSRSCFNGGICHLGREHNEHWCRCAEGFDGDRCENQKCPEVCQNGGKCLRNEEEKEIICQCPAGYRGRYCELQSDSVCIRSTPCGLNGRCHLNSSNEDYYCICNKGWTGPNCDVKELCPLGYCLNGGYCNSKLGCDCPPTFKGSRCETDVDECEKQPCLNGAKCLNTRGSFTCNCSTGYSGSICELPSVNCNITSCINGGFCEHNHCVCPPMFQGSFCELDINECETASPCQNSGTCVNHNGGYQCFCPAGFAGANCELNIDDCASNPCSEGSICIDGIDMYTCICEEGKAGLHCELEDKCASNPCIHGRCESLHSTGEYSCSCHPGFTGSHCEFDINECAESSDVCLNNGTCINTEGSFYCQCKAPLTGPRCDSIMEACATAPCLNHGTCVDHFTSFTCICLDGFSGEKCQIHSFSCPETKCQNGGICDGGVCICPKGTKGQFCENKVAVCGMESCELPRECKQIASSGASHCDCPSGYSGFNCEIRLASESCSVNPCQHGAVCSDIESGYFCNCTAGYKGSNCEKVLDLCQSSSCKNNGSCVHDANGFKCICKYPFEGETCESKIELCSTTLCGRNGRCLETNNNVSCLCNEGFEGEKCEKDIDECASSVCLNDGICENLLGGFSCRCKHPYWGENCQNGVDWCKKNPCHNNGSCITTAHDFYCDCQPGFSGKVCNQNENGCSPNPCVNDAVCIPESSIGYNCLCSVGFSGKNCQINEDDCKAESLCLNGGTCIDGIGSFTCSCPRGFYGRNCEFFVDLSQNEQVHSKDMATCASNYCSKKAADGYCNSECNYFACAYDGGDCSASTKPFDKCSYAEYCSVAFNNGKCDPICNTESCLFDGRDCDHSPLICPHLDYCSKSRNNGICEHDCNTLACGYDEDCMDPQQRKMLNGTLDVVILSTPQEFLPKLNNFLLNMTISLRVSVNLKVDAIGPKIFKWKDNIVGERIEIRNSALYMSYNTRDRRSPALAGIFLTLELDAGYCNQNCFSDIDSVASFVGKTVASETPESSEIRIYEAKAIRSGSTPPNRTSEDSFWRYLLGGLIFIGFLLTLILVLEKVNPRKRRSLEAPVYIPPTEHEYKQSLAQQATNSMQYHFFPPMFNNLKRTKLDTAYYHTESSVKVMDLPIPLGKIIPMKTQQKVIYSELSEIHKQAASAESIILPICVEKVNDKAGLNGRSPLHFVVSNPIKSKEKAVEDIVNLYRSGANLDVQDDDQETPLFMACRYQKSSLVAKLLELGANPSIMNRMYSTCLHQSAHNSDLETTEELLKYKEVRDEINEVDFFDRTPLMISAMEDWATHDVAEKLIKAGAEASYAGDKDASTRYRGRTALHYAALYDNIQMIKFLVEKGANKDAQDREECTPLFLAAQEGKLESVKALVECGVSMEITDQKELTPLNIAQEKGYIELVAYLSSRRDTVVILPRTVATRPQTKTTKAVKKYNRRKCHPLTPPDSDGQTGTPSPPTAATVAPANNSYSQCQALLDSPKSDQNKEIDDKYSPQGIDINNTTYLWQNNSGSSYSFSSPSYTDSRDDPTVFGNAAFAGYGSSFESFNGYSNPFTMSSCQHKNETKPTY